MSEPTRTKITRPIARKLPVTGTSITWNGKKLRLTQERNGVWRCRSRSKELRVDVGLGTTDLATAKDLLRRHLESTPPAEVTNGTLEQVAQVYLSGIPLRCNDRTASVNVATLRKVVETTYGKQLSEVKTSILPGLWFDFVAKRQGRSAPDFSSRHPRNGGINAALAHAGSLFRKSFRIHYQRHGIILPSNAGDMELLPSVHVEPAKVDDDKLVAYIESLADTYRTLWLIFGLARFAGLRRNEILAAKGKWFVKIGAATYVELKDRYEDGYRTKTGKVYRAMLMNERLADYLLAVPPEDSVFPAVPLIQWMDRVAIDFIRPYTGASKKPLHRLRGLYADHVRRETEASILARQEAIKEASRSLGHTSTRMTEEHYLSDPLESK